PENGFTTFTDLHHPPSPASPDVRQGAQTLDVEPIVITDSEGLESVLRAMLEAPAVGLDVETTGLDPFDSVISTVQLATCPARAFVVDCRRIPLKALQPVLDHGRLLIGHNLKFDLRHLLAGGLTLPGDIGRRLRDTMLASQILGAGDV